MKPKNELKQFIKTVFDDECFQEQYVILQNEYAISSLKDLGINIENQAKDKLKSKYLLNVASLLSNSDTPEYQKASLEISQFYLQFWFFKGAKSWVFNFRFIS